MSTWSVTHAGRSGEWTFRRSGYEHYVRRAKYENLRGETVSVHVDGKSEVLGSLLLVDIMIVCSTSPLICLMLSMFVDVDFCFSVLMISPSCSFELADACGLTRGSARVPWSVHRDSLADDA
jgi:hypothetical protein